jgi:hypothetical protein
MSRSYTYSPPAPLYVCCETAFYKMWSVIYTHTHTHTHAHVTSTRLLLPPLYGHSLHTSEHCITLTRLGMRNSTRIQSFQTHSEWSGQRTNSNDRRSRTEATASPCESDIQNNVIIFNCSQAIPLLRIRDNTVCHAGDRGSILHRGGSF